MEVVVGVYCEPWMLIVQGKKKAKRLFWKVRAEVKRQIKYQKKKKQEFHYDPFSYSLNFDDGGYLNKIRSSLKYLCPSEHIPSKIEVDISDLDIGDKVSMHDVQVHPSLKLSSKNETMTVCKIMAILDEDFYPKTEDSQPAA